MCYNSIGSVYSSMDNYSKALAYFDKALVLMKKEKCQLAIGTIYFNIAEVNFKLNNQTTAIQLVDSAEKIILQSGTTYNLNSIYYLRAEIDRKEKQYAFSENYFLKAINLNEESGTKIQLGQSYIGLAGLYIDIERYNKADSLLNKALGIFATDSSRKNIKEAYQKKLIIAIKQDNWTHAESNLNQYEIANANFLNDEKQKAIVAQEIKFDTREKEKLIQFQQEALEITKRENRLYLFSTIAAFLGICTLLWFLWRIKKQKSIIESQKNEIVHNTKNNLQQLISIFNRQAEDEGYRDKALDNQGRLQALTLLNQLLYDSASNGLVHMDVYLHELCKYKRIGAEKIIKIHEDIRAVVINPSLAKDIGLIVNELMTNSFKYAFNTTHQPTMWIQLSRPTPHELLLVVKDNGIGIDITETKTTGSSMGMGFVHDLIEQHHGQLVAQNENGLCYQIVLKTK